MPKYTGTIIEGKLNCTAPAHMRKWIESHEGEWWRAAFSIIGGGKDKNTRRQRGYYWGLLVPEICAELNRQGHTLTIRIKDLRVEIPHNIDTTHGLLTDICSRVGDDGDVMRISDDDMTVARMIHRIDNVLSFAVNTLSMNADALEARRPKDG